MVPVAKVTGCSGLAIAVAFLVSSGTVSQAQSGNPASTGQPTPTFTRDVSRSCSGLASSVTTPARQPPCR